MMENLVISFYGGPASGKTVAAAGLFHSLSKLDLDVYLISEFAAECIMEGNSEALKDQIYAFGNTNHRIWSSYQKAQVTITDAPILLNIIYQQNLPQSFNDLVLETYFTYNNLNILVERKTSYTHSMVGRIHSLSQSVSIDKAIIAMLDNYNIPYIKQSDVEAQNTTLTRYLTQHISEYYGESE